MTDISSIDSVYVAGPMTGVEYHNFPQFYFTTDVLKSRYNLRVENPADNDGGANWQEAYENATKVAYSWEYYLRRDLKRMLTTDALVVLPGWRQSRGAQLETYVARKLGMPLYRLDENFELTPLYTIVGLSGYAQSGKDTAASVLIEKYGFERRAFADPLKQSVVDLNPIIGMDIPAATQIELIRFADEYARAGSFDAMKKGDYADEARALWQRQGTEVGRALDPDLWVKATFNSMEDGGKYVITDARFPNEAQEIKAWGGEVWRINRAGVGPVNNHPSETSLDDWNFDLVLQNNSDVDTFKSDVECVLSTSQKLAAL